MAHQLLIRQLRKFCKDGVVTDLAGFVEAIDAAYCGFDNDRYLIERTLETMSHELGHRNRQLGAQLAEKQRVMDELTRTNSELVQLNQKLETAQNQLFQTEKMASVGQLAAGVAHEINNPVAFVHSNFSALEHYLQQLFRLIDRYREYEKDLPARLAERMASLRDELEYDFIVEDLSALMGESKDGLSRVTKIVQNLKDFSRVDTSGWEMVDVTRGLNSTISLVRNQVQSKAEIVCEFADGIPQIECLLSQLNQVFMNLLINAVHAIDTRGVITVRTGVEHDMVCIRVSDTGKGIAPEILPRIFDAFFTTKPVGQGTGLGLSLSYSIIKKHNGHIEVDSKVGAGTTFSIFLPIRQPKDTAPSST